MTWLALAAVGAVTSVYLWSLHNARIRPGRWAGVYDEKRARAVLVIIATITAGGCLGARSRAAASW